MPLYCRKCDRYFAKRWALEQHLRMSSYHNYCATCKVDFRSRRGRKEHYVQSRKHDYCQYCDEHFDDEIERENHMDDRHHYCRPCGRIFRNEFGLHEHRRQAHRGLYCAECKQIFQSTSDLNSHVNSSTHGPRTWPCPMHPCDQSFISMSALALHLESGTCKSGLDRQGLNKLVITYDRDNVITNPARLLIEGPGTTVQSTIAPEAAWNGHAYECYLCHREFQSLRGLNQHLNSPRHQDCIYRCPNKTCGTQFATLSGLCQHIESDRCGVMRFIDVKDVKDMIDSCIDGMKRPEL